MQRGERCVAHLPFLVIPLPVTTAGAVALGHTVLAHARDPTAGAPRLGDNPPRLSSLTSNPRQPTTAIATPRPADVTTTTTTAAAATTRENAHVLGPALARHSKPKGSGTERGTGTEIAAPLTRPRRSTNTSAAPDIEETDETGRGRGHTTGTESASVLTRANITAAVADIRGTEDTDADTRFGDEAFPKCK